MPIINITPSEAYKFSSIINNKIVLCLYHWKLCGHCIDFIPRWNKITSQYKDSIIIVNIELDAMNKLPDYYKVQAFPSIILYKNGKNPLGIHNITELIFVLNTNEIQTA